MKNAVSAKPAPKQPTLITQPSTVLSRNVRRYIASCVVATNVVCDFPNRAKPQLHSSAASAEVESVRHLRSAHKDLLSFEVKAVRKRLVRDESLEIVE